MPDPDPTTEQTPATPADNPTQTAVEETSTEVDPSATQEPVTPEEPEAEEGTRLSHEDAIAALADTRKENASWRTKYRDLEAKFAEAKTPEEVAAVIAEAKEASATEARTLLIENVGLAAGIPKEHHHRLIGDTREALEADAKSLAALLPAQQTEDPDLHGGLDGGSGSPVFDADAARKAARAARSRGY